MGVREWGGSRLYHGQQEHGVLFRQHVGTFNALSNIYCAWKARVPLLVTFSGGGLADQGKDSFEILG